jgi:hypothetical protein
MRIKMSEIKIDMSGVAGLGHVQKAELPLICHTEFSLGPASSWVAILQGALLHINQRGSLPPG